METDPRFWDCECEHHYILPKTVPHCFLCGSHQHDQPDSMTSEVALGVELRIQNITVEQWDEIVEQGRVGFYRLQLEQHESIPSPASTSRRLYGPCTVRLAVTPSQIVAVLE